MRHGTNSRRQRNRGNSGRRGNQNRSQVYDSNGPDVRIRGTAHQITEKYIALAKDATSSGDEVLAESYMQHAEHYQRIINSWNEDNNSSNSQSSDKNQTSQEADGNKKERSSSADKSSSSDKKPRPQKKNDDLGLPASILGAGVDQKETEGSDA